jgi:hypothetical protein
MLERENEYASRVVLGFTEEKLSEKKKSLDQELAITVFKLIAISEILQSQPISITASIRTAHNKFQDDGWTGGYVASQCRTTVVTSSYFTTAYLGALADQIRPIETTPIESTGNSKFGMSDYSSVDLSKITMDTATELDYPIDSIRSAFNDSKQEAFAIIDDLRAALVTNNPYKDIPIKINQAELLDALLRQEILKYCETNDPNFHIVETAEN